MSTVRNGSRFEDGHELANLDVHTWQVMAQRLGKKDIVK